MLVFLLTVLLTDIIPMGIQARQIYFNNKSDDHVIRSELRRRISNKCEQVNVSGRILIKTRYGYFQFVLVHDN